ncbi:hypothetical protein EI94DRAFT_1705976 [Lactarius quietus]|nr:hypothetical protein EI94DRAFT_1705976 [Lactarius quietus]
MRGRAGVASLSVVNSWSGLEVAELCSLPSLHRHPLRTIRPPPPTVSTELQWVNPDLAPLWLSGWGRVTWGGAGVLLKMDKQFGLLLTYSDPFTECAVSVIIARAQEHDDLYEICEFGRSSMRRLGIGDPRQHQSMASSQRGGEESVPAGVELLPGTRSNHGQSRWTCFRPLRDLITREDDPEGFDHPFDTPTMNDKSHPQIDYNFDPSVVVTHLGKVPPTNAPKKSDYLEQKKHLESCKMMWDVVGEKM